jgi:hypothetical protein
MSGDAPALTGAFNVRDLGGLVVALAPGTTSALA